MDFTAPLFLFFFLPIILFGYWICPLKIRPLLLLSASIFFYLWEEGRHASVLLVAIVVNYLFSLIITICQKHSRRLAALLGAIALNLVLLFSFKYPNMIVGIANGLGVRLGTFLLHLPLGISFFTFQAIAYLVDVYRGKSSSYRNPRRFSLFMSLFPKISAGPILRYEEVSNSIDMPAVSVNASAYGAKRFIFGMGKKLLIADILGKSANQIFIIPTGELTFSLAWLGIICYTLQLYFDFSGYSDMAIGLGRMFGFSFPENFNYPYTAKSVTEFWRRWHISLSSWFRDYLYTPLLYSLMTEKVRQKIASGQYKTNYRSLVCIIFVFALCGWWHGSSLNFIIWGFMHGIILAIESWKFGRALKKAPLWLSHVYSLLTIMICWVFFRSSTLKEAFVFIKALSGFGSGSGVAYSLALYLNSELLLVLILGILASIPVTQSIRKHLNVFLPGLGKPWLAGVLETGVIMLIFCLSLIAMASSTYHPFIYFRF
jgi:alginate O-acetyltransferase complex protein AlgI